MPTCSTKLPAHLQVVFSALSLTSTGLWCTRVNTTAPALPLVIQSLNIIMTRSLSSPLLRRIVESRLSSAVVEFHIIMGRRETSHNKRCPFFQPPHIASSHPPSFISIHPAIPPSFTTHSLPSAKCITDKIPLLKTMSTLSNAWAFPAMTALTRAAARR